MLQLLLKHLFFLALFSCALLINSFTEQQASIQVLGPELIFLESWTGHGHKLMRTIHPLDRQLCRVKHAGQRAFAVLNPAGEICKTYCRVLVRANYSAFISDFPAPNGLKCGFGQMLRCFDGVCQKAVYSPAPGGGRRPTYRNRPAPPPDDEIAPEDTEEVNQNLHFLEVPLPEEKKRRKNNETTRYRPSSNNGNNLKGDGKKKKAINKKGKDKEVRKAVETTTESPIPTTEDTFAVDRVKIQVPNDREIEDDMDTLVMEPMQNPQP